MPQNKHLEQLYIEQLYQRGFYFRLMHILKYHQILDIASHLLFYDQHTEHHQKLLYLEYY